MSYCGICDGEVVYARSVVMGRGAGNTALILDAAKPGPWVAMPTGQYRRDRGNIGIGGHRCPPAALKAFRRALDAA